MKMMGRKHRHFFRIVAIDSRQPRDGRLFLLADDLPEKIGKRFAWWSSAHLLIFFGAGGASLTMFL